jgi:hypothetical protein
MEDLYGLARPVGMSALERIFTMHPARTIAKGFLPTLSTSPYASTVRPSGWPITRRPMWLVPRPASRGWLAGAHGSLG